MGAARRRGGRMAEYKFCKVEDEGRIRVVTINRPEVLNALHKIGRAHV